MLIAIDASKISTSQKTGTETYSYELISHILKQDDQHSFILYSKDSLPKELLQNHKRVQNRVIKQKRLWSLIGLSKSIRRDKPDVLLVPASILPLIHPKKSFVVIHGLEYEYVPQNYSLFQFWHLVIFTCFSAKFSKGIIVPSQNTKKDLVELYYVDQKKIKVIPSGFPESNQTRSSKNSIRTTITTLKGQPYIFWIGRMEVRKNIGNLIQTFTVLKQQKVYADIRLILAGKPGRGYDDILKAVHNSAFKGDIHLLDFVSEQEKEFLYQNAAIFVFPSLYEGFGFPILEAQSYGVPVISSNSSSLPEVGRQACIYVDPDNIEDISEKIGLVLSDKDLRKDLIRKGYDNIKRFDFKSTANKVLELITS